MTASHIGHFSAGLQFLLDAIKRRNPVRNQVGVVAWPEKTFRAREQTLRMLVPANAFPGSKCCCDLGFIEVRGLHDVECTSEKGGRSLFGERHGLLGGERKSVFFGVIINISGRSWPHS